MCKVLLITQSLSYGATGGGLGGRTWVDMLSESVGDGTLDVAVLGPRSMRLPELGHARVLDFRDRNNKLLTLLRMLEGLQALCGLKTHCRLKRLIRRENYDVVFFDVSLFGPLVRFVAKHTRSKSVVHFQNIEKDYFGDQAKALPFWYRIVYWNTCFNERTAARHATWISLVNHQEEPRLRQLYGRSMDLNVPVCMPKPEKAPDRAGSDRLELLFVGAPYYANVNGIRHFIQCILPKTQAHLTVVGRDMDRKLSDILTDQVTCAGFVPALADAYAACHLVVAPLYMGAGMKVKIAEAWAYGKKVIATPFAASGYPTDNPEAIELCGTDEAFAEAVNRHPVQCRSSQAAQQCFDAQFDTAVVQKRIEEFLSSHV